VNKKQWGIGADAPEAAGDALYRQRLELERIASSASAEPDALKVRCPPELAQVRRSELEDSQKIRQSELEYGPGFEPRRRSVMRSPRTGSASSSSASPLAPRPSPKRSRCALSLSLSLSLSVTLTLTLSQDMQERECHAGGQERGIERDGADAPEAVGDAPKAELEALKVRSLSHTLTLTFSHTHTHSLSRHAGARVGQEREIERETARTPQGRSAMRPRPRSRRSRCTAPPPLQQTPLWRESAHVRQSELEDSQNSR
jgi:hypothetical protein